MIYYLREYCMIVCMILCNFAWLICDVEVLSLNLLFGANFACFNYF